MRLKRTAAQAGLSAGPPVPEGLLRQVVLGLLPERAHSELKRSSVCTKIANIAEPNGYPDVGLRIFHMSSPSYALQRMMNPRQMPISIKPCFAAIPNGALDH